MGHRWVVCRLYLAILIYTQKIFSDSHRTHLDRIWLPCRSRFSKTLRPNAEKAINQKGTATDTKTGKQDIYVAKLKNRSKLKEPNP